MKFKYSLFIAISFIVLLSACGNKDKEEAYRGPVLAKVNDVLITPDDFLISIELLYQPGERAKYLTPEGKQMFLQLLSAMELFYQEGKKQKLDEDPYIKKAVENYKRYLVYHTLLTQNINMSTIKSYFEENFFHVAMIRISKPKNGSPEGIAAAKAKAEGLLGKIKQSEDFGKLAQQFSDHPSKSTGGDPGPITLDGEYPEQVFGAAAALKAAGEVSPLVDSPDAFYILKLVEPYGQLDFAGCSDKYQEMIFNSLVQKNYKNYSTQLQMMSDVKLYPENLELINQAEEEKKKKIIIPTVPPAGIPQSAQQ